MERPWVVVVHCLEVVREGREEAGGGSGGGRDWGGSRGEKLGREDRYEAASLGRVHRSITESEVGWVGQLNKCGTVCGCRWHSGQVGSGSSPIRARYDLREIQCPERSCESVVLVGRGRALSD